jgi:hypothetical protein
VEIIHKWNEPDLAIGQRENKKILGILLCFGELHEPNCLKNEDSRPFFPPQKVVTMEYFFKKINPLVPCNNTQLKFHPKKNKIIIPRFYFNLKKN